jgi:hypothetical protein
VETLKLPDVIMAILDCRSRFPRATSAALIREYEDDDVFVYIVLLDGNRQPISVGPGTITAATYVARHLGEDLVAAFGGKKAVVLTLGPAEWGGRPGQTRPATVGPVASASTAGLVDSSRSSHRCPWASSVVLPTRATAAPGRSSHRRPAAADSGVL